MHVCSFSLRWCDRSVVRLYSLLSIPTSSAVFAIRQISESFSYSLSAQLVISVPISLASFIHA
jgi:hypothetical protein